MSVRVRVGVRYRFLRNVSSANSLLNPGASDSGETPGSLDQDAGHQKIDLIFYATLRLRFGLVSDRFLKLQLGLVLGLRSRVRLGVGLESGLR